MRRMPSKALVSMVSAFIVAGCSVKERRDECPCRLLLDFSEVDASVIWSADLLVMTQGGVVYAEEVGIPVPDGPIQVDVPRTDLSVNAYAGHAVDAVPGVGMMIPYGEQAPELYIHSSVVDTRKEMSVEKIVMRKEHCVVSVEVSDREDFPFTLEVAGNVCGYDVNGLPVQGKFMCGVDGNPVDGFRVVVPRQLDSSLELIVRDGTEVAKTFVLGEYLESSGYDWTKENLEDVTVWLDYSLTYVVLAVQGWDEEFTYKVEI